MGFLGYLAPHSAFPKVKEAARKALELDPALPEAHTILGWAAAFHDWDWAESDRRFLLAEDLAPSYVLARTWRPWLLLCLSRFDEAIAENQRALELDPLSLLVRAPMGAILHEARQFERAIEWLWETLDMDPDFVLANFHLGRLFSDIGQPERAIPLLEKAAPVFPVAMGILAGAWAKLGRRDKAEEMVREMERLSAQRYVGPFAFAAAYHGFGDSDLAVAWLEKAFEARDAMVPLLKVHPGFDDLRSHPRFRAVAERLRLPGP